MASVFSIGSKDGEPGRFCHCLSRTHGLTVHFSCWKWRLLLA
jgi:hypothetical protein